MAHLFWKSVRKICKAAGYNSQPVKPVCEANPDVASEILQNTLRSAAPCMIARLGNNEARCVCNYLSIQSKRNYTGYLKGDILPWWWEQYIVNQMHVNAGVFPKTEEMMNRYAQLVLQDLPLVDVLGSWLPEEKQLTGYLNPAASVRMELLNPYLSLEPWTKVLEGKRVLVVHPFASTIEKQYTNRLKIFPNGLLPAFELQTIQAVQSIAGSNTAFNDWFEALEWMKNQIDAHEYDICLIGCGAYGFHLAAHVKRSGKKSVHLGGALQLLFGIRGARWENPGYSPNFNYSAMMNEYWVKPGQEETPAGSVAVEGGCYW